MKTLCLHGSGTSAAIFEMQTMAFRAKLDSSFEFDFVDAPYPSPTTPGFESLFKGPTYTFWTKQTVECFREAHAWLRKYMAENGPYDAVCCFSQGCSLISTFLLYHAKETPNEPLPFKAAIFICGGVPLPALEDLGLPVSKKAWEIHEISIKQLTSKTAKYAQLADAPDKIQTGLGLWDYDKEELSHDHDKFPDASDVYGLDFTAFSKDIRIKIPTVNIYGAKDPRYPAGMQLSHFCDNTRRYDHGGGHEIPRKTTTSNDIAELVRWCADQI
ncbi:hypothetical protein O988_04120 [Pseudogymnoascus sp. VKM F-3808]|nr:hypothetical protein O988_04120 [Pseudogymnoascus sp. VKM F-3808]